MSSEEELGAQRRHGWPGTPSQCQRKTKTLGAWCPNLMHPAPPGVPILGMITGTLILVLVPATKRGHADQLGGQLKARTSWLRDMKALIRK